MPNPIGGEVPRLLTSWARLDTRMPHAHPILKTWYCLRGVTGISTADYHGILGSIPGADIQNYKYLQISSILVETFVPEHTPVRSRSHTQVILFFYCCYAATQLALQLHLERSQGGYRDSTRLLGESCWPKKCGAAWEYNCTEIEK